jgi:hypothetical protein
MLLQPNNNKFGLYKEKAGLKLLPPQEGLICNLDMEKIVGTTIYDRTANGRNFTSYNSPSAISGIEGLNKGLEFNGTNQYAESGTFSLFDYDTFTVEAWFLYEASSGKVYLIQCGDVSSTSSNNNAFLIQLFSNTLTVRTTKSGTAYAVTQAISPINYYQVTYQIINRTTLRLYLNGVFISERAVEYPNENSSGYRRIDIQSQQRTGQTRVYSDGNCLSLRVWDRTLSDKEISYLYNNGYGIK